MGGDLLTVSCFLFSFLLSSFTFTVGPGRDGAYDDPDIMSN